MHRPKSGFVANERHFLTAGWQLTEGGQEWSPSRDIKPIMLRMSQELGAPLTRKLGTGFIHSAKRLTEQGLVERDWKEPAADKRPISYYRFSERALELGEFFLALHSADVIRNAAYEHEADTDLVNLRQSLGSQAVINALANINQFIAPPVEQLNQ